VLMLLVKQLAKSRMMEVSIPKFPAGTRVLIEVHIVATVIGNFSSWSVLAIGATRL
jgi:hypothetical protein